VRRILKVYGKWEADRQRIIPSAEPPVQRLLPETIASFLLRNNPPTDLPWNPAMQRVLRVAETARSTVSQAGSAALNGYDSEALLWLELFTLWAKMRKIGWDVSSLDEFRTVILQVSRLAANSPSAAYHDYGRRPARLTPEQISIAANKRATTDEFVCEPAAVQPIVEGLVRLANRASETGRTFYFLMSRKEFFNTHAGYNKEVRWSGSDTRLLQLGQELGNLWSVPIDRPDELPAEYTGAVVI